MHVHVIYKAQVKKAAQKSKETIALQVGSTLDDLLTLLAKTLGTSFSDLVYDNQARRDVVLTFIGNQQVLPTDNPTLADGDNITLMSPIAGG